MNMLSLVLALSAQEPSVPAVAAPASPGASVRIVVVREHLGEMTGAGFGHGLAVLGDLDHDGLPDYAIGAPRDPSSPDTDGSVEVHSGKTGALRYLHRGTRDGAGFGFALAGGDCDGDGIADVVVAAPYANDEKHEHAGCVGFFAGKDGRLLREIWGEDRAGFGWALTALGDIDRDGCADYAIGAPYADQRRSSTKAELEIGRVDVYSGKKARLLFSVWGNAAEDRFGWSVTAVDDSDGDDVPDFLVGAEGAREGNRRPGSATLVSGRNGNVLARFSGDSGTYFGASVCSLPDLDGDGRADLAVGAWNAGDADERCGEVRILSSRTRKVLHTLRGRTHLDQFGRTLAATSDLDGDGVADFVVGAPSTENGGYVQFVSSKTLTVLAEERGARVGERFGVSLCAADLDGDGRSEVIVGVGVAEAPSAGRVVVLGVQRVQ
ncbi:MAG: FG-GAP-like repeat-containing protein [Planctomycetota bacterium]